MSLFADWARKILAPRPPAPTTEELERQVEEAATLLPLWHGPGGELTRRLVQERERELTDELIVRHIAGEKYALGLERVAGFREALNVIDAHLRRGAAAQLALDQRERARVKQ